MTKNKVLLALLAVVFLALPQSLCAQFNWKYTVEKGKIVTEVPLRAPGQTTALQLTTPKMPVVRVGFVGLGMRGPSAVERWMHIPGIEVVALCDYEAKRAEACQKILRDNSMPAAAIYAIEVPSAINLREIWTLIDLSEKTRLHCVMLENCCYDFFELNSLNMAQKGVFGDVIYAQGAYKHELSSFWKYYWKKNAQDKLGWRLEYNKDYRGDLYATHGLGPIAQVLNIHRGDRMRTLVAMDTKSFNGKKLVEKYTGEPCEKFENGDQTMTLIRTEQGKVIEIHHNVMTPQPYNRMYQLTGTEGFANKYPVEGFAVSAKKMEAGGVKPSADNLSGHSYLSEKDKKALEEKYLSPIIKRYGEEAKEVGGHGGMDFIMDSRLVEVPDFTRGDWNKVKGFTHAYASPADEAATLAQAKAFTAKLKEKGKRYWDAFDKKNKKK